MGKRRVMESKTGDREHVLLAMVGSSAATFTEAIWALAVDRRVPLSRAIILTTRGVRDSIESSLEDALNDLRRDYPSETNSLMPEWRVFALEDGAEPEDIRTTEDNTAMATWIQRQVADLAEDVGVEIHASLAGGRKTMSFYVGAALQLLGRPFDHLYHILVDPAYQHPQFYYPAPAGSPREFVGDTKRRSADARVDLADVPFVPLRGLFRADVRDLARQLSFEDLTRRARDILMSDVHLHVRVAWQIGSIFYLDPDSGARIAAIEYRNPETMEFAFYSYLLWRQARGLNGIDLLDYPRLGALRSDSLTWIRQLNPGGTLESESLNVRRWSSLLDGWEMDPEPEARSRALYDEVKPFPSRLDRTLRDAFAMAPYHPDKHGIVRETGRIFRVSIPPRQIAFDPPLEEETGHE